MLLSASPHSLLLDRRALIAGLPLLLAFRAGGKPRLLTRAIERAGGRDALRRARVLRWTGKAMVFDRDKTLHIGVDTMVEPFVRARSNSWLLEQGMETVRSIVLEPADAWLERRGTRLPIPERMREHERQQFAIYGLMRLVDLEQPGVAVINERDGLHVHHPSAPETVLRFDADAKLVEAENQVPSAADGVPVRQRFTFSDHRMASGILWPRLIRIEQNSRPYFELHIASFTAG